MECRMGCAACCIAPSISSAIPGLPEGKPAGVRCLQLTPDNLCRIFGRPERPAVCRSLRPEREMCGDNDAEALETLTGWEQMTCPEQGALPKAGSVFTCSLEPGAAPVISM